MGIRKIQTERILNDITHSLYASGTVPTTNDIMSRVSRYFSQFPVGTALPYPVEFLKDGTRSDVKVYNQILAHLVANLEVLYESSLGQVDEVLDLTAVLNEHLIRLRGRRKSIEAQIDSFLLSQYNTDGYFFSASDTFSDLSLVDVALSSAEVDVINGTVLLSSLSSLTKRILPDEITNFSCVTKVDDKTVGYETTASFSGAVDGMDNTIWAIRVSSPAPVEVIAEATITLRALSTINQINIDPYGITPVQIYISTNNIPIFLDAEKNTTSATEVQFGDRIVTASHPVSFSGVGRETRQIKIVFRKTEPDYIDNTGSVISYGYLFGAKDLTILEKVYDNQATFVSSSIGIPDDLRSEMVIDAVSLTVDQEILGATKIKYYIAQDPDNIDGLSELSDFDWKSIDPIGSTLDGKGTTVFFNGAKVFSKNIRSVPSDGEIQLINPDSTNNDLSKRNPTPSIVSGVDIYRVARIEDTVLLNSLVLEEGINTTKILFTDLNSTATDNLNYWADILNNNTGNTVYGRIDTGNGFFYGGDVGNSGSSVYVETFLEVPEDREVLLAELQKLDSNSSTWTMRAFLNGREVGFLPAGTKKLLIPWSFRQGQNHIALTINIPDPTSAVPNPYLGVVSLLGTKNLYEYGTVKLGTWEYVDIFDLKYNQSGQPRTFSIHDKEIVSRRKPTNNFRIKYAQNTGNSPASLRFRADLSRPDNDQHTSPKLNSYRLRFLYGDPT